MSDDIRHQLGFRFPETVYSDCHCPRCGEFHLDLDFHELLNPSCGIDGYAICPETQQPIFMVGSIQQLKTSKLHCAPAFHAKRSGWPVWVSTWLLVLRWLSLPVLRLFWKARSYDRGSTSLAPRSDR